VHVRAGQDCRMSRAFPCLFLVLALAACAPGPGDVDRGPVGSATRSGSGNAGTCSSPAASPEAGTVVSTHYMLTSVGPDRGFSSQRGASVTLFPDRIEFAPGFFRDDWTVRADEVEFCAMTCFGMDQPFVDLIVPGQRRIVSVEGRALLDWCWSHRKPILDGDHVDAFEYDGKALPPAADYAPQFADRALYDKAACRSCAGW
jgi:hypothetical protein